MTGPTAVTAVRRPRRGQWIAIGAVGLVAAALVGGLAFSRWSAGGLMYDLEIGRPGFTTLHVVGSFRVDLPAAWRIDDTATVFSGGSSIAILGTLAIEARCGGPVAGINCVYQQVIEPGTLRIFIGSASHRGGSILDEVDLGPNAGTVERTTIAGVPAVRIEWIADPATSYYREDRDVTWRVAHQDSLAHVYEFRLLARDPGAGAAVAALAGVVESLRFDEPPVPLPSGDAAGPASIAAARAFLAASDAAMARGYGSVDGSDVSYYACFDGAPGETTEHDIDIGPGGRLGGSIAVRCTWTIEPEGTSLWRLALRVEWRTDTLVAMYEESHWLDAGGGSLGSQSSGEIPSSASG